MEGVHISENVKQFVFQRMMQMVFVLVCSIKYDSQGGQYLLG